MPGGPSTSLAVLEEEPGEGTALCGSATHSLCLSPLFLPGWMHKSP